MVRYVAEISYNGSCFSGWQKQTEQISVQQSLEENLSRLNNSTVNVIGAGRTDAGVHAKGQVCSFDMSEKWDERKLILALNSKLPEGLTAMRLAATTPDFHARYDVASREYIYFVWTGSTIYPHLIPFTHWMKGNKYNWTLASEACKYFEGEHNFGNFCRRHGKQRSYIKTIYKISLKRRGSLVWLRIKGSGFLTNMVRIIFGSLEVVAKNERNPEWIKELLEDENYRAYGGRTFPPTGLFLWKINYKQSPWNSHGTYL